jgi:hypothetical protein
MDDEKELEDTEETEATEDASDELEAQVLEDAANLEPDADDLAKELDDTKAELARVTALYQTSLKQIKRLTTEPTAKDEREEATKDEDEDEPIGKVLSFDKIVSDMVPDRDETKEAD